MLTRLIRRFFIACAMLPWLCGCGGGGGSPATSFFATATPVPTATPTAAPTSPLSLSQASLAFAAPGQSATVTASEAGYSGPITAGAGTCGTTISVTPASAVGAPAQFTVTAQGSGSCTITFTDRFGQTATLSVGVTVTQGTIQ
jgi:hypothetical protein